MKIERERVRQYTEKEKEENNGSGTVTFAHWLTKEKEILSSAKSLSAHDTREKLF
jgi:hypothetical protein